MKMIMSRLISSFWVVGLAALISTAPISRGQLGLDVTSSTQIFTPAPFDNVGWQFTVSSPILVNGLGVFDVGANGLSESHITGLWDNGGTLLATTSVSSASTPVASASAAGDWLFNSIAPVLLAPGTYVVGAYYATGADFVMANATITTAPQITFAASRASSNGVPAEPGVYGLVEPGVFGPGIEIQSVSSVPDHGSTLALLCMSVAGLLAWRRWQRRIA